MRIALARTGVPMSAVPPTSPSSLPTPILVQALYFVATGLWSILHLRSFMFVTGPKRDRWLVRTFGALVAAIGGSMLASGDQPGTAARFGIASGVALALAEVVYVARRRIRPVYLADAVLELVFAIAAARTLMNPTARMPAEPEPWI
jgi:hypothetical protein